MSRSKIKRSKAKNYLSFLLDQVDLVTWALTRPANFRYEYLDGGFSSEEWAKIRKTAQQKEQMRLLRYRHWIEAKQKGTQMIVRFSQDALAISIKELAVKKTKKLPKGVVCLVVFDFPVGANDARQYWRRFLLLAGFKKEQLSVWFIDKDVLDEVQALIRILGVGKWVKIFKAEKIGFDFKKRV